MFKDEYLPILQRSQNAHVVMLVDFDGNPDKRRARFDSVIPADLRARVYVIGSRDTPETLRRALGKKYEEIGRALAEECDNENLEVWNHEQLEHNDQERVRLAKSVAPFLFDRD